MIFDDGISQINEDEPHGSSSVLIHTSRRTINLNDTEEDQDMSELNSFRAGFENTVKQSESRRVNSREEQWRFVKNVVKSIEKQ